MAWLSSSTPPRASAQAAPTTALHTTSSFSRVSADAGSLARESKKRPTQRVVTDSGAVGVGEEAAVATPGKLLPAGDGTPVNGEAATEEAPPRESSAFPAEDDDGEVLAFFESGSADVGADDDDTAPAEGDDRDRAAPTDDEGFDGEHRDSVITANDAWSQSASRCDAA